MEGDGGDRSLGQPVLVLTGGPAVGKTTTAHALARELDRSVVIDVDDLRHLVVARHAAPWEGDAGSLQQELGVHHACALAQSFATEGFAVVVADVLTPATASLYRSLLDRIVIVDLMATRTEVERRASLRPVHLSAAEFGDLHAARELHPPRVDCRLEVTGLSFEQQVEAVRIVWASAVGSASETR